MLSIQIVLTVLTIVGVLIVLYQDRYPPSGVLLAGVIFLTVAGVLKPADALAGFANVSIAIIILLTLIASAIMRNFKIETALNRLFHDNLTPFSFYIRMVSIVSFTSSIVNNTPIVAAMTPYVYRWARSRKFHPSKFLMALSFATILGGVTTIIGTSTNLLLVGLMQTNGIPSFSLATFSLIGLFIAIPGIVFLIYPGFKMMPDKQDLFSRIETHAADYFMETTVEAGSTLIGQSVRSAGLRHLKKVYLHEIKRFSSSIFPVKPDEIIQEGDILYFSGTRSAVVELAQTVNGLSLNPQQVYFLNTNHRLIEIIITAGSSLINQTVRQVDFRSNYSAAILAVRRAGGDIRENIGDHRFKVGDTVLVITDKPDEYFEEQPGDFLVISSLDESLPSDAHRKRTRLFGLGFVAGVFAVAAGVLDFFVFLLAILLFLTSLGFYSLKDLRKDLNFDMVGMLVFSLAFGQSLITSGTAQFLIDKIQPVLPYLGYSGTVAGLLVITIIATNIMTNAAAVALVFPIAMALDHAMPGNQTGFYLVTCFGASCCFASPLGYQTNLMVYGPGGYNFFDFVRIGAPLTIISAFSAFLGVLLFV